MAHMIPDTPPTLGPGSQAERELYLALKEHLSDEFFVYHGLQYLRDDRPIEGEADFMIVHREHGLLVIECKGHGVCVTGNGKWVRVLSDTYQQELKCSPFEQARRHIHDLVHELGERSRRLFPEFSGELPFFYGSSVAFPLAKLDEIGLPLETTRKVIFDITDLPVIRDRVMEALEYWRDGRSVRRFFEPHEFKRFRKQILHPRFCIVEKLGARVEYNRQRFARLSEQQIGVVRKLADNRRLRVRGGAGTGKTVLAIEALRYHALQGRRALFVCFNRNLAQYVRTFVADSFDDPENPTVKTFHQLSTMAMDELGQEITVADDDKKGQERLWNEEAPLALLEAFENDALPHFDAIVVDEGQDFATDWWDILESGLSDSESSYLWAFYDPFQNIFGRDFQIPENWPSYLLDENFRNTKSITRTLKLLRDVQMEPHIDCPEGVEPIFHKQDGPSKTCRQIEELVAGLLDHQDVNPEDITILTPHSRPNSILAEMTELAGRPLADHPLDRQDSLLHTTIGKFKGLESEIVIMADVDLDDPRCDHNACYVAASRARQLLHVFYKKQNPMES